MSTTTALEEETPTLTRLQDHELINLISNAQNELKARLKARQDSARERAQADLEALRNEQQALTSLGVHFTNTNHAKKGKRKAK